jgi:hypothetical protein
MRWKTRRACCSTCKHWLGWRRLVIAQVGAI